MSSDRISVQICGADLRFRFATATAMPVSLVQSTKRALVSLLKSLAVKFKLVLSITRDSDDAEVRRSYRTVSRRVHPDRGGSAEDQKKLNVAYGHWEKATREAKPCGRKSDDSAKLKLECTERTSRERKAKEKGYRIQSQGILLTYQKFSDVGVWHRFVKFVKCTLRRQGVQYWCATMETNADGSYHLHLMLQFHSRRDRTSSTFAFEGVCPNAQPSDLLGDGWGAGNTSSHRTEVFSMLGQTK